MMEILFWLCVTGVIYIYIGYPVMIKLFSIYCQKTVIEGNYEQCPHCEQQTLVENRNLVNE